MEASDQRLALHTLDTWDRAIDWRITREVAKGIGIILPSVAIQINITPEVIEARKSVASQIATWYDEWGEDNYFELPEMIEEEDLVEMARDLELPVPSTLGIGEIKRLRHQLRIRHIQQRTEDINNAGPEAEEESTPPSPEVVQSQSVFISHPGGLPGYPDFGCYRDHYGEPDVARGPPSSTDQATRAW